MFKEKFLVIVQSVTKSKKLLFFSKIISLCQKKRLTRVYHLQKKVFQDILTILSYDAHHGKIGKMVVLNLLKKSQQITFAINLGIASLNCKDTEKIIQNSGKIRCSSSWCYITHVNGSHRNSTVTPRAGARH